MRPRQSEVHWSPELAYAVGLITTDGSLSKDGRHIEFVSNDKDLIITLQKCLGISNKISKKRSGYTKKPTSYRVQFGNVTLHKWLVGIGLMPNKSKQLSELKVPDEFFSDFLRGHLDGDGTIRKYFDPVYPKSLRLYVTLLSASLSHVLWLQRKINNLVGINGFLRRPPRVYSLTFSKFDSIKLLRYLYPNPGIPCLERKFLKAREFVLSPR